METWGIPSGVSHFPLLQDSGQSERSSSPHEVQVVCEEVRLDGLGLSCIRNKSIDISNPLAHRAHIKTSSVDVDKRAWWNSHNPSNGD